MMSWAGFKFLGSSLVMIPAGLAIGAWLIAGRAWRMASLWSLLFGAGLGMVAATKIAFIGWGMAIDPLDFQGISGHAMRATAVVPVALYLALPQASRRVRISGVLSGILFGAGMGVAVSAHDTHSASEAIAGCILGGAISLGFIRLSQALPKPVPNRPLGAAIACGLGAAVFVALASKGDPAHRWLTHAAVYLSGNETPFVRQFLPPSTPVRCRRVVSSVRL